MGTSNLAIDQSNRPSSDTNTTSEDDEAECSADGPPDADSGTSLDTASQFHRCQRHDSLIDDCDGNSDDHDRAPQRYKVLDPSLQRPDLNTSTKSWPHNSPFAPASAKPVDIELNAIKKDRARPPGLVVIKRFDSKDKEVIEEFWLSSERTMSYTEPNRGVFSRLHGRMKKMKSREKYQVKSLTCECVSIRSAVEKVLPCCMGYDRASDGGQGVTPGNNDDDDR